MVEEFTGLGFGFGVSKSQGARSIMVIWGLFEGTLLPIIPAPVLLQCSCSFGLLGRGTFRAESLYYGMYGGL